MSIKDRIRRLEGRGGPGCQECRNEPQRTYAYYPQKGDDPPEPEHCPECGRPLGIIFRVLYGEEGEGGIR